MKKVAAAVMLMASVGLMAGCQESPEDKMEDARESMSDAVDSMQEAAGDVADATEQKAQEMTGNEPTAGEVLE